MDHDPIKGLTINIRNEFKEDIVIIFADPNKKDVVELISDKCILNLVDNILHTKVEDKEKEMSQVKGKETERVEVKGDLKEEMLQMEERKDDCEDDISGCELEVNKDDCKDDIGVRGLHEIKRKEWEKVWVDAWNLEMERRKTAEMFLIEKSQNMKKEFVDDFDVDNFDQEIDMLENLTEAIKDDPDYSIQVKGEQKISPKHNKVKKLKSKSSKKKKSSRTKSIDNGQSVINKTCRVCGKKFDNLTDHIRTQHKGEKPFSCDICGKAFLQKGSLRTHKTKHIDGSTKISKVTCEICGKLINDLTKHMRTHTGEKPYSCDICGKGFAQNLHLKNHKMVHSNERPFSCDICGNGFTRIHDLTDHRRIHTGEKPYSCDVCERKFIRTGDLNKHKKTHSGVRPFSCETCGAAFYDKNTLNNHIRIHKGEKNYCCKVCEKKFLFQSGLNEHLRIHTGEKPYSCDSCGRAFAKSHHLKTHKNTCSKSNVKKEYPVINHL